MVTRYKSIGIRESDYVALAEKKQALESLIGKRLDWADFLLLLADLKPISQIARFPVAELHESEGEPPTGDAEADVEEFPGLPVTLAREDQERIAELVATKVVQRLKKRTLEGDGRPTR